MPNTHNGYIIAPDDPSQKITGVRLEVTETKIIVEIPKELTPLKLDILTGFFTHYGYVTLVGCRFSYKSLGFGKNNGLTKYEVKYLFSGIIINKLDEIKFSKAFIEMPSLSEFCVKTLIKRSFSNNSICIAIDEPEEIQIACLEKFSLAISIGYNTRHTPDSTTIEETFKLKIYSEEEKIGLFEFLKIIERFQSFMLLILNYSPNIKNITFYKDDYFYPHEEENHLRPIEFFTDFKNIDYENILNFNQIKFSSIQNELESMITHWYNNTDLHISIDLLTEKFYNVGLSRENYFLNACFAIEIFHRRLFNDTEYPNDIFEKKLKSLCENIEDKKFVSLIKSKLQFANEFSFRKRLKFFKADFTNILPQSEKVKDYISKIVDTRNYLVHRSSEKIMFEGIDLFYAAKYLESVLRIHFLKTINCPDSIIDDSYSYVKENLHQFYDLNKHLQTEADKNNK